MATREEKIAFLQSQADASPGDAPVTREQKIAFLQAKAAQPADAANTGQGQTALEGFANGASLGYLPQLQAMAAKPIYGALNAITGQDVQPDSYVNERDANIARQAAQAKANPKTALAAKAAGGVATGIATAGLLPEAGAAVTVGGKVAQGALQGAKVGAIYGAAENPGDTQGVVDPLQAKARVENAGKGLAGGAVIGGAAPLVGAAVRSGSQAVQTVGDKMKSAGEKFAVNATGATGKQASKFSDDAGRELLDRGVVRFGDSQAKIAERASGAVEQANSAIDEALKKLDARGVTVDGDAIKARIADKIKSLKQDPSQADVVRMLNTELDNVQSALSEGGGNSFGISDAEKIKRGYSRKAGNWADPEKGQAGKEMYQTFRSGVEDAAQAADPDTAKAFEEAKKSYGLLKPIEEAAERRAATTQQHPAGGFLDVTTGVAGASAGGPLGAIAAPIARRVIAPRLASSAAVTFDKAGDLLRKVPQFAELEVKQPAVFQAMVTQLTSAGESGTPTLKAADQKPTKGPEKWQADGLKKLEDHAQSDDDTQVIEKAKGAMNDPATKKLLIAASDLKPGTRAMAAVLAKLKEKTEGGR